MAIKILHKDDEVRWDEFVYSHAQGTLCHTAAWRLLIHRQFGHQPYYLYSETQTGEINGLLPLIHINSRMFGSYMVSMPYLNYGSAIGHTSAIEHSLIGHAGELAAEIGVNSIEFRDIKTQAECSPVRTDKVAMILDLPTDKDQLWKALGAKRRAQIKRPQREGVQIRFGRRELLGDFYSVFAVNMRDLGTPVYSKGFFQSILENFEINSQLIVVYLQSQPVGAAFLLGYKKQIEIPWAASLRRVNSLGINMLLYWEALSFAINQGMEKFDFGRSTMESGTYRFKKQWGAKPKQLYWHYWLKEGHELPGLTPDNAKYRFAIALWKKLPVPITRLLGPGIVKNLP